jgi:large subunit ribosomal protein L4
VQVVSSIVSGDTPSTKSARKVVEAVLAGAEGVTERTRVLAVVGRDDTVSLLSLRNLPNVHLVAPDQLNTYDVLVNDVVLFTSESLDAFLEGPVAQKAEQKREPVQKEAAK